MKKLGTLIATVAFIGTFVAAACDNSKSSDAEATEAAATEAEATQAAQAQEETAELHAPDRLLANYDPMIDPANFVEGVDNPYFPLVPGTTNVYEGTSEEGNDRVEFMVTDQTREIMGIQATVVLDRHYLNDELIEETNDWFAQDKDGNVWYMGEETAEIENGEIVSTSGSFEAGVDGALPGIVMLADPQVGDEYLQEYYPGEAEDFAKVLSTDETVEVPFGTFENCLQTEDINPFEPDVVENKYYCPDIGTTFEIKVQGGEDMIELVDVRSDGSAADATATEPQTGEEALHAPERLTMNYEANLDAANFVEGIDNPYFPLVPGTKFVYEGMTEDGLERIEVEVTHETKEILGITATVVLDQVFLEGELKESTLDWYAQDKGGNVWYLGEETAEYENGEVVSVAGSFEAGIDGALAGIVMPANPQVGDEYLQEFYVGEAEDFAKVLAIDESVEVAYGSFDNCLKTEDINPFEPDVVENKYYCPGVGHVLEIKVQGGDERVELIEVIS